MSPIYPDENGDYGTYDINEKAPRSEPETLTHEEFADYCFDLYDVIKYGTRKQRKRAARKLVLLAVDMRERFMFADNRLQEWAERPAADVPAAPSNPSWQDRQDMPGWPTAAPSYLDNRGAEVTPSCVINEHAHGDDSNSWVHVDDTVNRKLHK
jgi:hypothetical protein